MIAAAKVASKSKNLFKIIQFLFITFALLKMNFPYDFGKLIYRI